MDTLWQDVRYAARLLRRSPVFTATAVLSLAVGIGANTAIFTVANGLFFRAPARVIEPGRLVDVLGVQEAGLGTHSYPNFLDIRQRVTTLEALYGYQLVSQPVSFETSGGAERVFANLVTTNYFTVLGVSPAVGRLFSADAGEQPGASPVVVLSHAFWMRRFNEDTGVVGRTIRLNGHTFTVSGVAPEGFHGTTVVTTDVWIPTAMAAVITGNEAIFSERAGGWMMIGGRLNSRVSTAQAATELDTIGKVLEHEYPDENRGRGLRVVATTLIPGNILPAAGFLALLMGLVSIVLIIACANLTGVLLARATMRRREVGVRLAVGAGPRRLVRQLVTETMLLFLLGGAAGLLLARGMTSLLVALVPALPIPLDVSIALDVRIVVFAVGLSLTAALLSGLVPAWQTSKADVISALRHESQRSHEPLRLRNALVAGQVAFSILLIVGAGLLIRALERATSIDPGFDPRGVELVALDLSVAGYTNTSGALFARDLVERVGRLPGVQAATMAATVPMGDIIARLPGLTVPGVQPPNRQRFWDAFSNSVEPGYFTTMRIQLTEGRDFNGSDVETSQPVAIVSAGTARRFWPGQSAVGKYLRLEEGPWRKSEAVRTLLVIGVAGNVNSSNLSDDSSRPFVYMPLQQQYASKMTIVVRTRNGQRVANDIRTVILSLNSGLPIVQNKTLEENLALSLVPQRIAAAVAGSVGIVGLLLAGIGIYGVAAFVVARRTREIGVRAALGARPADIVFMVLGQGMSPAAIGSIIGVVAAAATSRLLTRLLFGVPPLDPVVFGGAILVFALVSGAACVVPARRATWIDPVEALRAE